MQQQQEAATLSCACGHSILCELMRQGERLGFLAFFDDDPTSETRGERVESCPGCGEQLGFLMPFLRS